MGRPQVKDINLGLLYRLRRAGLGWRTIARRYYSQTKDDINWMTLRRRLIEADLAARRDYNDDQDGEESN